MYILRQYTLPLLLAFALHVAAAWALYQGWHPQKQVSDFVKPRAVVANLVVMEAKATPKVAPPPPKTAPAPPKPDPEVARRAAAEKAQAEAAKKEAAEKAAAEKAAAEKAAAEAAAEQARQERLQRLSELANSAFDQAIAEESENLQAGTEDMVAQSFRLGIYQEILQNWSRPPSARNGMQATLLMELIPNGEVVSVTVVESSGNIAFDRSAEQAVRRVGRFNVPAENHIFERHFRQVYLLFQPEDLLR
ncbi:MAG: cell envelope integrity protein TolA [Pseudomonadota bacterium]